MCNSRGILMFAHNNSEIDYLRLAVINSMLIKKHLGINQITVVTDQHSLNYTTAQMGEEVIQGAIDKIVLVEKDLSFKNKNIRTYKDTSHTAKQLPFYNLNRCDAYDLSPYDETILLDVDYLILSNALNQCWGHNNDIMMNWQFQDVMTDRKFAGLDRLHDMGITMYWATVVYFKKTDYVEAFFNCVKHVRDNVGFYKDLYKWHGSLYRNDYTFSIAAHMIAGFVDKGIPQLPTILYKTFDNDDVYKALGENSVMLYLEKPNSPGDFMLTQWRGVDLHVMNKWALNRVSDQMISYLQRDSE
jgi:hypothetical protein